MFIISDKEFKTKKSLEDYIRQNIIYKIGITNSLKQANKDAFNFLVELFKRHPDYPKKTAGLCDILIRPNKVKPTCLELNFTKDDGSIEDISWLNCVSETKKDDFKSACRMAVEEQIKSFRNSKILKCCICETTQAKEYQVDHEIHFEEILNDFIQTLKIKKPTKFTDSHDNRKIFLPEDKEFEDLWKEFHKSKAKLRILCKHCNLKRPKWKDNSVIEKNKEKENQKKLQKRIEKLGKLCWSNGISYKDLPEDVLTALYNSELKGKQIDNLREYINLVYEVKEIEE